MSLIENMDQDDGQDEFVLLVEGQRQDFMTVRISIEGQVIM